MGNAVKTIGLVALFAAVMGTAWHFGAPVREWMHDVIGWRWWHALLVFAAFAAYQILVAMGRLHEKIDALRAEVRELSIHRD